MEDESETPREPPVRLDYFAAPSPRGTPSAGLGRWWAALVAGWAPFLCGAVSSRAVVLSGVPDVVTVHVHAGAVFMGVGLAISAACAARFARARDGLACATAIGSLLLQLCAMACVMG